MSRWMSHRIRFATACVLGSACAAVLAASAAVHDAVAQTPKPAPKAQPKSPAPPPGPQQPAANPGPQTIYSPWVKLCERGPQPTDKQVCFITQYGQNEGGQTVVLATLIDPEGERRALRLTLPLGVQLTQGMRATVDQGQPIDAQYRVCAVNGCTAEIEASSELIGKLKTGKGLLVQGVDFQGYEVSYSLPLEGFAKAFDGAPVDPKELDQQRKLQEDLARRAAEARKRLEDTPPPKK
jgi:invasion protein IalB